jgi:hypothetical protein
MIRILVLVGVVIWGVALVSYLVLDGDQVEREVRTDHTAAAYALRVRFGSSWRTGPAVSPDERKVVVPVVFEEIHRSAVRVPSRKAAPMQLVCERERPGEL